MLSIKAFFQRSQIRTLVLAFPLCCHYFSRGYFKTEGQNIFGIFFPPYHFILKNFKTTEMMEEKYNGYHSIEIIEK